MTTRREQRDAITNLLNIKSLKSWNICCKQQPEALDRQDVQERELVPTCARCCRLSAMSDGLCSSQGFLFIGFR